MNEPLELLLPEGLPASRMSGFLAGHLSLLTNQSTTTERTYWDTTGMRLRAAGLALIDMGARLMLADVVTLAQKAAVSHKRGAASLTAGDIAAGELRDGLAELLGDEPVAPVARVRTRALPVNILGEDGKTVVRLLVLEADLIGADLSPTPLRGRLKVSGVAGCEDDLAQVRAVLEGELGFAVAPGPVLDDAVAAAA